MQVFKLYMKVLNKYKGQIIMYVGIFAGLLFGFIIPNFEKSGPSQFTESKAKYAIFDYDNSELSKHIGEYLDANHELVELKEDDTEIIQDGGATFRFVVGDYGSGKTFLLQTIKEYCVKNDFIVATLRALETGFAFKSSAI